jgi:DNA-binding transcriptional MerR regulator
MRIGELAAATGVRPKALRFYEAEGLVPEPERTSGGYRDYPEEAIDRVAFIRRAQAAGLTLAQIAEVLAIRDEGNAPCAHVAHVVDQRLQEVTERVAELKRISGELLALRQRLQRLDPVDCDERAICKAIHSGP